MHWIDWSILIGLMVVVSVIGYRTQQYTKSVADFLAANRCAGKYVLGVADGIAGLCAISIVAQFEVFYKAGFTAVWWGAMILPVGIVVAVSGWIQYRFRQTRAMTMAQFFELRYSRRFRIFAGLLAFVSGTINFGIFPAVAARFFQYYCGFPTYFVDMGPLHVDLVYAAIMFFLVGFALLFTIMGGQIIVMVTDFVQGSFVNVCFVIVTAYLMWKIDWGQMFQAFASAPPNASMLNPLKTGETENFNMTYFVIQVVGTVFTWMGWQGNQGYYGAAKTPHDARMGRVIGQYRPLIQTLPLVLLPVLAYTFYNHASFAEGAQAAQQTLSGIETAQLQSQLTVTVALRHLLPIGIIGLFAGVMFAAFVTTHDTYLHSWGSIFIQDVLLPIRNTIKGKGTAAPLTPERHLRWLRYSITGVAVFIFLFSLVFNQQQDILMYFALTGTIYLGWVGAVIVGGLYTKWGTTTGAWVATIFGIFLAIVGWYMTYFWGSCQDIMQSTVPALWDSIIQRWPAYGGAKCPITAQVLWGLTMLATTVTYVAASLLSYKGGYDLDRLLHRGAHAPRKGEEAEEMPATGLRVFLMGKEYTLGDRCLVIGSYAYSLLFFVVFLVGTLYAFRVDISDLAWMRFWYGYSWLMLVLMIIMTVWLIVGGVRDVKKLMRELKTMARNDLDDGTVIGHLNLDEVVKAEAERSEP